jgi:hypothetical protein
MSFKNGDSNTLGNLRGPKAIDCQDIVNEELQYLFDFMPRPAYYMF